MVFHMALERHTGPVSERISHFSHFGSMYTLGYCNLAGLVNPQFESEWALVSFCWVGGGGEGGHNNPPRTRSIQTAAAPRRQTYTMRAHPDLTQGLADLQSTALTTELCTHVNLCLWGPIRYPQGDDVNAVMQPPLSPPP